MTKCRKRIVGKASRPSDSARLGLETSLATLDNSIGFPFKSNYFRAVSSISMLVMQSVCDDK